MKRKKKLGIAAIVLCDCVEIERERKEEEKKTQKSNVKEG